jgi:hypothetical protein
MFPAGEKSALAVQCSIARVQLQYYVLPAYYVLEYSSILQTMHGTGIIAC